MRTPRFALALPSLFVAVCIPQSYIQSLHLPVGLRACIYWVYRESRLGQNREPTPFPISHSLPFELIFRDPLASEAFTSSLVLAELSLSDLNWTRSLQILCKTPSATSEGSTHKHILYNSQLAQVWLGGKCSFLARSLFPFSSVHARLIS